MSTEKSYAVELSDRAKDVLARLQKKTRLLIERRLIRLEANAESIKHVALKGEWQGYYRMRAGDYRIIYWIDHEERVIVVELIGHRRDIYDE